MTENELEAKLRELEELQGTLSREEFIAKVETELKPLCEQEIRAHVAQEPDWKPLEKAIPLRWCAGFMFIGYEGEIRIYKQGFTRQVLYVDPFGNTFSRGCHPLELIPHEIAIEEVFHGIEQMGFKRSTPYDKTNAEKSLKKIEKETGYKRTFGDHG